MSTNEISFFSIQHQVVYTSAYRIFKDNIFFGIGPKMFREKCKRRKISGFNRFRSFN